MGNYNTPIISDEIKSFFSEARLSKYDATFPDREISLTEKYIINKMLSELFLGEIALFEVFIRNAISEIVTRKFKNYGFFNTAFFSSLKKKHQDSICDILRGIDTNINNVRDASSRGVTPGLVISRLGFGFWIHLFDTQSKLLDSNYFGQLFPIFQGVNDTIRKNKIQDIYQKLVKIRDLRNRVCHHEIILNSDYETIHHDMISIIEYFNNPYLLSFFKEHSQLNELIDEIKKLPLVPDDYSI